MTPTQPTRRPDEATLTFNPAQRPTKIVGGSDVTGAMTPPDPASTASRRDSTKWSGS